MKESNREKIPYTLLYILTCKCNFHCAYCYESVNNGKPDAISFHDKNFTSEKMLKVVCAFRDYYQEFPENIVFFGGEPLLMKKVIFDFVGALEKICEEYGNQLPKLAIITNASLFDKEFQKFAIHKIDAITFSIDGVKELQDEYRRTAQGKDSFGLVVSNIREFQKMNSGVKITAEVTLTDAYAKHYTPLLAQQLFTMFADLGIPSVDFIPVQGNKYSLFHYCKESGKMKLLEDIVFGLVDTWFNCLVTLNLEVDVISFRNQLFSLIGKKNSVVCGAGRNYFCVLGDGQVYSCQVAMFNGESSIGVVEDKTLKMKGMETDQIYGINENTYCASCECFKGCTVHCDAQWRTGKLDELPDACKLLRLIRRRIFARISRMYEDGDKEKLIAAVKKYYAKRE